MVVNEFGALLKACRERKGLSQEQLAKELRVDRSSISRIETGHDIPDIDEVLTWADVTESREIIAAALVGNVEWQKLMKLELAFKQMQVLMAEVV